MTKTTAKFSIDAEVIDNRGETREVTVSAEVVYTYWPYVPQTHMEPAEGAYDEIHSIKIMDIVDDETGQSIGWITDTKALVEKVEKEFEEQRGDQWGSL